MNDKIHAMQEFTWDTKIPIPKLKRCVGKNTNTSRCKRKMTVISPENDPCCYQHKRQKIQENSQKDAATLINEIDQVQTATGICYECAEECNPCSQLCGRCMRCGTMSIIGWKL